MKRLLPLIPVVLFLILINSCTVPNLSDATVQSPTPVFTVHPNITEIIKIINNDLSTINPLEWAMDAQYHVIDINLVNDSNASGQTARMNVDCICMNETKCCTPARTFVVVIESMRRSYLNPNTYNNIASYLSVLDGAREFTVVCNDEQTNTHIGAVSVAWQDIRNYLSDPRNAVNQLEAHAHTAVP